MVSRRQLREAGWTTSAIDRLVDDGGLHCLHRGVYAVGHRQLTAPGRWLAAVLAAGDDAIASHQLAGAVWEVITWRGVPHVTVPRKLPSRMGLRLHHRDLPADEVTTHDGIPVTTVARTLLDLAALLPKQRLERAVNEAEYRRYGSSPSLPELIERHRGARGLATLREILDKHDLGQNSPAASSRSASSPSSRGTSCPRHRSTPGSAWRAAGSKPTVPGRTGS